MQDYYAARATEYDKVYAKHERQADLRQIEQWLPSVLAGRSVLEVACGTGYTGRSSSRPAARASLPSTPHQRRFKLPGLVCRRRRWSSSSEMHTAFLLSPHRSAPVLPASGGLTYLTREPASFSVVSMRRSSLAHQWWFSTTASSLAAARPSPSKMPRATRTKLGFCPMAHHTEYSRTSPPSGNSLPQSLPLPLGSDIANGSSTGP